MRKHNYPKTRKSRDTSYSQTWKLTQKYGLDHIKEVWTENGMYKTSQLLDASPYIIRYIAQKHHWTRPAEKAPVILAGVKAGNMPAAHYKTLDFSNVKTKTINPKKGGSRNE